MKIGIYGGSFNPVHFGHTGLAIWIARHTDLDEVWLMVTPNNPLKDSDILAPEKERYEAACKAVEAAVRKEEETEGIRLKPIRVSDFEFTLPKPNYTAKTLSLLSRAFPQHEFCLIIGEDNWHLFTRWREWESIGCNYTIYVYPRKSSSLQQAERQADTSGFKCVRFLYDAPLFDISSTQLRLSKNSPRKCSPLSSGSSHSGSCL